MLRQSGLRLRQKVEVSILRLSEVFPLFIYWVVLAYAGAGILGVYADGFRSLMKLF